MVFSRIQTMKLMRLEWLNFLR